MDETTKLVDAIGIPALFEQMAEECMELGHACLKYSRYLRDENKVHGRTEEELLDNVHEEMADVYVTMRELRKAPGLIDNELISSTIDAKRKRMAQRLGVNAESFIF